jgi:hypothetical protein
MELWVYSESNGCFNWRRDKAGDYHCFSIPITGPTEFSNRLSYRDELNQIKEAIQNNGETGWEYKKSMFRPPSYNGPSIIDGYDYPTIESIEHLCRALEKIGPNKSLSYKMLESGIQFYSRNHKSLLLNIQNGSVKIGNEEFKTDKQIIFFRTLFKTLSVVTKGRSKCEARFSADPTGAYQQRTVIEFNISPEVVVLNCFSNGPDDEERLYGLDIDKEKNSTFWYLENK